MALRHWLLAARPHTLPLATASALCGGVSAALYGRQNGLILGLCVLTAVLLQIFSNLANDYGDACHGADSPLRRGPERMVSTGRIGRTSMKRGLAVSALLCCLSGAVLIACALPDSGAAGRLLWLLMGAAAVTAAFTYTAGRKPYGYSGWGDVSVLVFFGWLGVLGSEYLQTGRLNAWSWLPATALGLWCSMVLNLNNMRDITADAAAGKATIAVRLGLRRAKRYHAVLLAAACALWAVWTLRHFPAASAGRLNAFLAAISFIHLYSFKKAPSSAEIGRLLPQWSITILAWVLLLWTQV